MKLSSARCTAGRDGAMSGRGAGGFPLPPLSPGSGAVAAALGAPPTPAGPGMLPGPALRGPGPAGGVGAPGAAAFRPMGPAGPAAQYQVRKGGGASGPLERNLGESLHGESKGLGGGADLARARSLRPGARVWGNSERDCDVEAVGSILGLLGTGILSD